MSESSLFELFIEETREHLEKIDEALLNLEREPGSKELINSLFRSVHTIKGSTAVMSYTKTSNLIHKVEDLIHLLREEKLLVNQKIIQLLFVTHDFLENFLEVILHNGSESELQSDHILQEVQLFLSDSGKGEASTPKEDNVKVSRTLTVDTAQMEEILLNLGVGESIFQIRIKLSKDCVFKSIRVWMLFEEVEKLSQIIASYPSRPSLDDFKNGTFNFTEEEILLLVSSEHSEAGLGEAIDQTSGIDTYQVAKITIADGKFADQEKVQGNPNDNSLTFLFAQDTSGLVDSIIDYNAEDEMNYSPGFLQEIRENAQKAEESLRSYLQDQNSVLDYHKLYRHFHTARGLGDYIEHVVIQEIAAKSEELVDYYRKHPAEDNRQVQENLRLSAEYIVLLCQNPMALKDQVLTDSISRHCERLQAMKNKTAARQASDSNQKAAGANNEQNAGAVPDPATIKEKRASPKKDEIIKKEQSFIRIPEHKIDYLVDMLGELIIFQSQHKQEVLKVYDEYAIGQNKMLNGITKMERITKELQNLSMSLRMVSLKQTLQKLARIGRDTAVELGKTIEINIYGEDTEIDRSIVEKIQDPLLHLLRNAIGHGLEEDEQRIAAGKRIPGRITIQAYNRKGNVYIEVGDDGQGLNLERIYQKALHSGLIDPDREYSEEEIANFIFLPGLSTQDKLNAISGRGVGMNVVETEIKKIGGRIEIQNKRGAGCTFILKIPINLATINGTIVEICSQRFIIPTVNIKHIFKPQTDQWIAIKGKVEFVKLRDQLISLIPTEKIFNYACNALNNQDVVIIILEMDNEVRALPVGGIVGKQEIVQKPLGSEFARAKIFSGGTILGDGKVSLIVDIESLFKVAN